MLVAVTWTDAVTAIGGVATPVVVLVFGFVLNKRIKVIESLEWRNQELTRTRLALYREIAGPLNDLLCYFTFIGGWKDVAPPDVVRVKRHVDKVFYVASPLFGEASSAEYRGFMEACFSTFGGWGADARLKTGYVRRKEHFGGEWNQEWESLFTYDGGGPVEEAELNRIKARYSSLLAAFVRDIQLLDVRPEYVDAPVVLNAG